MALASILEKAVRENIQAEFNEELQYAMDEEDPEENNSDTPNYYDYWEVFPDESEILLANIPTFIEEVAQLSHVPWIPWPEDQISGGQPHDWTVFPFLHTFPALDESRSCWIGSTAAVCPKTVAILRSIPNIRTALFSKLAGKKKLNPHTGWSDLANYVLRLHVCLDIPATETCGLVVNGEVKYHEQGEILVFDDSKRHLAFNTSDRDRIVLIIDLLRPIDVPLGKCIGGHTAQLDGLMQKFN